MSNAFLFNKKSNKVEKDTRFKILVERTITEVDDDTITKVGNSAFANCSSLTSISLPAVTEIATDAFHNCINLTSVSLPSVTKVATNAFNTCKSLINIDLPLTTSIGSYAFQYCSNLTNINSPLVKSIDSGCFYYCTSLTSVNLPLITKINGQNVFSYCSSLTSLIIRTADQICSLYNYSSFNNTPIANGTGYIYVPSALIESYKTASNWSKYAAQFRALENYTVDGTITGELDPNKI